MDADDGLEALFAEARARAPRPDAALVGRVLADAVASAPQQRPLLRRGAGFSLLAVSRRIGRGLAAGAVGWRMPVGLTAALVAGLWLGATPPAPLLMLEEILFAPDLTLGVGDPVDWLVPD